MSSNEANQEQDPVVEELDQEAVMKAEEEALVQAEDDLIEQLNQAKSKAEENWDLLLRTKAEMENLRRRTQIDLENAHKYGIEKFVSELIPVMDSMELGLAAEEASAESLREGMTLTINMVSQMFEKFNIKMIDPMNEKFDPELHQAMAAQPTDDVEPNTVIAVMQKGYILNERLVRPAMVMVSKAAE
ncbi:MAG: nucleotide exchange factor GrpE [Gammaproteobacteria bacterium]|nr:nucleotide exchange factor GrpE [Gammaproteobacteria bacterium]